MDKHIGKVYGQLTVTNFAGVSQLSRKPIYECQCNKCHRKWIVQERNLTNNLICNRCKGSQK